MSGVASPMEDAIHDLFRRYEEAFNAGLASGDTVGMAGLYAEAFVGSSPAGVAAGCNDGTLTQAMAAGFARYREQGGDRFAIEQRRIQRIDDMHALVPVAWVAHYLRDGRSIPVRFTVTYMVQVSGGRATVFGWISGDEQTLLREYGLV